MITRRNQNQTNREPEHPLSNGERAEAARVLKHDNFVKLARQRVTAALERIDAIRNLANRSNYDYNEEEVDKIVGALESAVQDVQNAFESGGKAARFDL